MERSVCMFFKDVFSLSGDILCYRFIIQYAGLGNMTENVNLEEWMAEYDRLTRRIGKFSNQSGNFNLPGFDNMTTWEIVMAFVEDTTNDLGNVLAM